MLISKDSECFKTSPGHRQHFKGIFFKDLDTKRLVLLALLYRSETLLDRLEVPLWYSEIWLVYLNDKQHFLLRTVKLKGWEMIKIYPPNFQCWEAQLIVTNLTCQCCNLVSSNIATVQLSLVGLKEKEFSLAFLLHTENAFSLHLVPVCSDVFTLTMVHHN